MSNLERQKELAKEAVKLIRDYIKYTAVLGDELYESVRANKSGSKITIIDSVDDKSVYDLVDISSFLSKELRGFGPFNSGFYESIELEKNEFENKIETMSKKEFIKYAGEIIYIETIAEKMYERLQEIEEEAKSLANI